MQEFRYGDRVRWEKYVGVVVDDRKCCVLGSYEDCLPLPVAVRWEGIPNEVWWVPGDELELA